MFAFLLEELLPTLPNTDAQRARILRAQEECGDYRFETYSDLYHEAACQVTTRSGNSYLCFPDQCTCPDWTERVWGSDDLHACKHQVACFIQAAFVEPAEAPAPYDEQPPVYWPEELIDDCPGAAPVQLPDFPEPDWDWDEEETEPDYDPSDAELLCLR